MVSIFHRKKVTNAVIAHIQITWCTPTVKLTFREVLLSEFSPDLWWGLVPNSSRQGARVSAAKDASPVQSGLYQDRFHSKYVQRPPVKWQTIDRTLLIGRFHDVIQDATRQCLRMQYGNLYFIASGRQMLIQ